MPAADRRRRQRSGGRARLQPRRALRHRVHGGERASGRPARAARARGGRRRARGVAAAHEPAAGQGVRADGGPHPGRAGRPRSAWSTTSVPTTRCWTRRMACAHRIARLPKGAVEDTKRVINIQLERAVLAVARLRAERGGPVVHDRPSSGPTSTSGSGPTRPGGTVDARPRRVSQGEAGSPLRCCAALSASQPPSASPAASTCASAMARAARAVAARPSPRAARRAPAAALLLLRGRARSSCPARPGPPGAGSVSRRGERAARFSARWKRRLAATTSSDRSMASASSPELGQLGGRACVPSPSRPPCRPARPGWRSCRRRPRG